MWRETTFEELNLGQDFVYHSTFISVVGKGDLGQFMMTKLSDRSALLPPSPYSIRENVDLVVYPAPTSRVMVEVHIDVDSIRSLLHGMKQVAKPNKPKNQCGECRGNGKMALLTSQVECWRCGGTGRVE